MGRREKCKGRDGQRCICIACIPLMWIYHECVSKRCDDCACCSYSETLFTCNNVSLGGSQRVMFVATSLYWLGEMYAWPSYTHAITLIIIVIYTVTLINIILLQTSADL